MLEKCIWKTHGGEKHVAGVSLCYLACYAEFVGKLKQAIVLLPFSPDLEQKIGFC